jgi:hypothetical protein
MLYGVFRNVAALHDMVDVKLDEFPRKVCHAFTRHLDVIGGYGLGADFLSPFTSIACETPLGVVPIKNSSPP